MNIDTERTRRKTILQQASTIAIVGLSPKVERPSNMVARYLLAQGYRIIPVNPGQQKILDQPCYSNLTDVPGGIDIVVIFRRSEEVAPIVRAAITRNIRTIWMQQGISNAEAARQAEQNGCFVVMDRCIKIDHQQLVS